jgi:four helix bundle protein
MRTHRSLKAWITANKLARQGIRLARLHWKPYASGAFSQLQRASLSAQLNIAEGYSLGSRTQFRHYLRIAYGSAVEAGEILELLADEGVLSATDVAEAREAAGLCQRLLLGLLHRMRQPA